MSRNIKQAMQQGKCQVCRQTVMVDEYGNGEVCGNFGWHQDSAAKKIPYQIFFANKVSFDKAKKLYSEGRPLEPDFEDFIDFCDTYRGVEFLYNKTQYFVSKSDNENYSLYVCRDKSILIGEYQDIDDFAERASIGGLLLKDLWGQIKNFEFCD